MGLYEVMGFLQGYSHENFDVLGHSKELQHVTKEVCCSADPPESESTQWHRVACTAAWHHWLTMRQPHLLVKTKLNTWCGFECHIYFISLRTVPGTEQMHFFIIGGHLSTA